MSSLPPRWHGAAHRWSPPRGKTVAPAQRRCRSSRCLSPHRSCSALTGPTQEYGDSLPTAPVLLLRIMAEVGHRCGRAGDVVERKRNVRSGVYFLYFLLGLGLIRSKERVQLGPEGRAARALLIRQIGRG